ncbi:pre-mRNA processing factor 3 (PRP3) domain-containing protein [Hirsutella rhossiliensis]|uniref:Pre-mRNA processing factor 3 (PRP3) domain-containing protein n=1 Tax=Hirsutella rhossiliensis TaxID=111463 RepID=A0A9P8N7N1_9HYPO|nr:pre-mRNA processing factor 3 (PRP3) domain-containing protein [Hirsutella rhossiliensis]KAH0968335.1 pre-mRNA processing factor 3 (PRP3) domain-containing protein [Hirsutella rhossiliensis]
MAALKARVAAAIDTSKAKGGLNVGLHPVLENMGSWKPQGKSRDGPKTQQSSQPHLAKSVHGAQHVPTQQTQRQDLRSGQANPYFDDGNVPQVSGSKRREPKRLVFNQKGKYIQQASALRRQAALEAMKRRIAEQTRKAGIDDDLDVEKNFVVEAPPGIEWWDEGLVDGQNYDGIENPAKLKLITPDSIVTEYVQHPVALEPPQNRLATPAKPMFLTSKEQAKLRRQRRMAELKEMQAKIRLGLVPAPPPKVKKGNLMRVLGDVAVKDPTAVEARVNREIAERHQKHVEANEERQLTKEQKHDKLAKNQQTDADKGIHVLVFKITTLANGQHRYKIAVNAEQLALSGTCIMHPKFNMVVVEGGAWGIAKYKKLMLNRIDWTENSPPRRRDEKRDPGRDWLQAESEDGTLKDMSLNECKLIFEGEQKARAFRKWGSKVCETDAEARETLARAKMDTFWSLAKCHA